MIVVLMGTIAFLTAWGLWHRQRIETAKASVQAASEAGMAALKDGNFAMAARELSRARDAVDLLGDVRLSLLNLKHELRYDLIARLTDCLQGASRLGQFPPRPPPLLPPRIIDQIFENSNGWSDLVGSIARFDGKRGPWEDGNPKRREP